METKVNDPLLVMNEESAISTYINELIEKPFKKRFDEESYLLFEIEEDMLLESLKIKDAFGPSSKIISNKNSENEFPLNLFHPPTFELKRVFIIAKFNNQEQANKDLIVNDVYEIMGKFFPGEGGLLFETKLVKNMRGMLSFPFLQTMKLIQEEFVEDEIENN